MGKGREGKGRDGKERKREEGKGGREGRLCPFDKIVDMPLTKVVVVFVW